VPGTKAIAVAWRKSSACVPRECVEVASVEGYVFIRDSAEATASHPLAFPQGQWRAFLQRITSGQAYQATVDKHRESFDRYPNLTNGKIVYPETAPDSRSEAVTA
jgi:hypothetical protein